MGPIGPDSVVNQAPVGLESRILSESADECVRLSPPNAGTQERAKTFPLQPTLRKSMNTPCHFS